MQPTSMYDEPLLMGRCSWRRPPGSRIQGNPPPASEGSGRAEGKLHQGGNPKTGLKGPALWDKQSLTVQWAEHPGKAAGVLGVNPPAAFSFA